MSDRRRTGGFAALLLLCALCSSSAVARAEQPTTVTASALRAPDPTEASDEQRNKAQRYYEVAKRQFDARQFEAALESFTLAQAVVSSPNTQLYRARCLVELGRLTEAYRLLDEVALHAARLGRRDPRYNKTHDAARDERDALGRRLGFVRVVVRHATAATRLFINGRQQPREAWSTPIVTTPGKVEISVRGGEGSRHQKRVIVAAGTTREVTLDLGTDSASKGAHPVRSQKTTKAGPTK